MKRTALAMSLLSVAMVAGCEGLGTYDGAVAAERSKREAAKVGAPAIVYTEVPYEGRIYVVSSLKAAEDARKGVHPATALTKIGAGPNRETVVFEANKFVVEDALIAEFNKRHGTKLK